MKLLVDNVRELLDHSEAYFKAGSGRCYDNGKCVYLRGDDHRCVIGNILFFESDYERFWTRQFKGACDGLLYGLFGLSPRTNFVQCAIRLQMLHDDIGNWVGDSFIAWSQFYEIKGDYT